MPYAVVTAARARLARFEAMKSSTGNGKSVVGRAGRGDMRWEGGGKRAEEGGESLLGEKMGGGGGTSVVDTDHGEMNKELDEALTWRRTNFVFLPGPSPE